ncbi:MAG: GNAT family N-acetyltransferase [Myxococcales bacterium]|nr:GNAT family N-acetyltransferase [Myxococcales bacterium]
MADACLIRRIDPLTEVALIAERMRLTLIEVLGHERGSTMYSQQWLADRVRWHLDEDECTGEVWVAESSDGEVMGHIIVRHEPSLGSRIGLISTVWVQPEHRRQGLASALVVRAEHWMVKHGLTHAATHTSATNWPLIRLFERHGFTVVLRDGEMVRLRRELGNSSELAEP